MAWFSGNISLGNFPDFAGAVNKLSESVKNIEKNFDNALGFEERSDALTDEGTGLFMLYPSFQLFLMFEYMYIFSCFYEKSM